MGIDRSDDPERGEVALSETDVAYKPRQDEAAPSEAYALGESKDRAEYFESLRESAWDEAVERFRERWDAHRERWPEAGREPVDRSEDPEASWRGDSNRYLDAAANGEVDARYERIAEVERNVVSPAMREIESCDSDRTLVGWEYRLKGPDRFKDKVAETMAEQTGLMASEALADVSDSIRFTFQYSDAGYCDGVRRDVTRIKEHGFELVRLKNYWSDSQYKGINSQWIDPDSSQRFEVQFHTDVSFEAKQLTHSTYERLRSGVASEIEEGELEESQQELTGSIPVPPDAEDIKEAE